MRKRILAILLTAVMVLTLVPTLAFAEGTEYEKGDTQVRVYGSAFYARGETLRIVEGKTPGTSTILDEDGKICKASVKEGYESVSAFSNNQYFENVDLSDIYMYTGALLGSGEEYKGGTVILDGGNVNVLYCSGGNDGKTTGKGTIRVLKGNVGAIASVGSQKSELEEAVVEVQGGTIGNLFGKQTECLCADKMTINITGGTFTGLVDLSAPNTTTTVTGGTFEAGFDITAADNKVDLKGGQFARVRVGENSGLKLADLLADGYNYEDAESGVEFEEKVPEATKTISNVAVVKHECKSAVQDESGNKYYFDKSAVKHWHICTFCGEKFA